MSKAAEAPIRVLGIETSCDETAVGIVENGKRVLGNAVASSLELHGPYGGVIPEIAARMHVETAWPVLSQAFEQAKLSPQQIDAIAVTQGPGLPGALLIGLSLAKGLSLALDRPLIPVDHLAAHLYAGEMADETLEPPYVGLIVSGGHTLLCVVHPDCRYEVLGETQDDAVGEAFDKVAKLLGLGYPGGPVIDRLAQSGNPKSVNFPRSQSKEAFDFSFSGLKTAVYNHVRKHSNQEADFTANVAASFQEAAVDVLVTKTLRACQRTGMHQIVCGGGVASNRRLRERLGNEAASKKIRVIFPPPALCVDNGAMVAGMGYPLLRLGRVAPLTLASRSTHALAV